jgi:hypothetical protein
MRSVLPDTACRLQLESSLLGLAGLIEDPVAFDKRAVRVRTAVK